MATYDASASSCKWAPGGPKKRTKRKQNKRHKTPNEDGILEKQKPRNKSLHNIYTYVYGVCIVFRVGSWGQSVLSWSRRKHTGTCSDICRR